MLFFFQKNACVKTPHRLKSHFAYFWFFFGKKPNYPALVLFWSHFSPRKSWVKSPTHPKILFFSLKKKGCLGDKNKTTLLSCFCMDFCYQKNHVSKRPHTLKSCCVGVQYFFPQKYPVISAWKDGKKDLCFFWFGFGSKLLSNFGRILVCNLIFFDL